MATYGAKPQPAGQSNRINNTRNKNEQVNTGPFADFSTANLPQKPKSITERFADIFSATRCYLAEWRSSGTGPATHF